MKSKILIIGDSHPSSLECMYYWSLKKIYPKVLFYDPFKNIRNFLRKRFLTRIFSIFINFIFILKIKRYLKKSSNISNIIFFKGEHLNINFIKYLKKKFYITNIMTDDPFFNQNKINKKLIEHIHFFDLYLVWSKNIKTKIIKHKFLNNQNVFYLPFAYSNRYRRKNYTNMNTIDKFLFYGSWDTKREELLSKINNKKIDIYGNGWEKASAEFKKKFIISYHDVYGKKLSNFISSYKLCINLDREQVGNAINMRVFEVIGYGGCLVTKENKEIKNFFKRNKHYISFKNIKHLSKILNSNLNLSLINKIKKNSLKVSLHHNYINRSKYIIRRLELKKMI